MSGRSDEGRAAWAIEDGPWGSDAETAAQLLARMAALPPDHAEVLPFRHPRLLAPAAVAQLVTAAPADQAAALDRLRTFSTHANAGTLDWPIGIGPVERLAQRVLEGLVSLPQATGEAGAIGDRGDAIAPYVRAVARFAVRGAAEGGGEPSLVLTTLLLAATPDATDDARCDGWTARRWAIDAHVEVARVSLAHAPDDQLYGTARACIDEVLAGARDEPPEERALAESLAGRFMLDIYASDQDLGRYDVVHAEWLRRRRRPASGDGSDARAMPEPVDALREACAALDRATRAAPEMSHGVAWKALVQAQRALALLDPDGATANGVGLVRRLETAREARLHLDPARDADKLPFVELVLAELDPDAGAAAPGDDVPLADIAQHSGPRSAITTGLWRLEQQLQHDPGPAQPLADAIWTLADDHADEDLRQQVLKALTVVLAAQLPPGMTPDDGPIADRAARLERLLADADPPAQADALVGLASTSGATDEEQAGLALLDHAGSIDPTLLDRRRPAIAFLLAALQYGHACNLGAAGALPAAIEAYVEAAARHARCGLTLLADHCLGRVEESAARGAEAATATVVALAGHALDLERMLGERGSAKIAGILRQASAGFDGPVAFDLPLVRDQVAKGLRFAAAVTSPSPLVLDERARSLLDRVRHLEATAGDDRAGVAASALDDEDMLVSFVSASEALPGRTPAEQLVNQRRRFDEHLAMQRYAAEAGAPLVGVEQLQQLLGPRTVLISVFLGAFGTGMSAVHTQAFTRESYDAAVTPYEIPSGVIELEHDGVTLTQSPVGLLVASLRRAIVDEPTVGPVHREAQQALSTELPRWFGPFAQRLTEWRRSGYDHLVVWPHGPLHYLPWHLFSASADGPPIADEWTVTVLPTLGSLLRAPDPRPAGASLVAVGCAEGGLPYGLAAAPGMPVQAEAIAAAFGAGALREPTPSETLAALGGARFVHVAAHGSHVEEAPAFQCLYLRPDADGEGRLFAYELAGADLGGVELVTLSACESALGRFDLSDNLRGMPAALLASGASAVVGAMWPVGPEAATTFFTTLYSALGRGSMRLEAFREAQLATRRDHPRYYDWGAMTYIGDWR